MKKYLFEAYCQSSISGHGTGTFSYKGAVMQVYGADTWGWHGWFAIHTWFAPKRTGESNYKLFDVVGW